MKMKDDNFLTGSIVALVTPMRADGSIDLPAWHRLLDWHLESGTDGVVVAGTTGESATLLQDEYDALLAAAVEQIDGRIPVLAGTGSASTASVVAVSQRAAKLGADAVLVVAPYYNRPPQRGLLAHYRAVADACPVPVVLYNVPGRTVTDLKPETAIALAEHANIIAIKEAVPDEQRLRQLIDSGLPVLSGDDPSALMAMQMGARGVISVVANIAPEQSAAMSHAALRGDHARAEQINNKLESVVRFLNSEINPIPAKWLLAELGRIESRLRLPLVELSAEYHAAGRTALQVLAEAESK